MSTLLNGQANRYLRELALPAVDADAIGCAISQLDTLSNVRQAEAALATVPGFILVLAFFSKNR